jgi:Flp pilus assembly protein TadD
MPRSSTTWVPGRSGNPGGRPRAVVEVRDLARGCTEAAVATLLEIMTNPKAPAAARVAAAVAVLDRGWGRPPQAVAVAVEAREPGVYAAMLQQVEQRAQAEERERRLVAEPRLVAVE